MLSDALPKIEAPQLSLESGEKSKAELSVALVQAAEPIVKMAPVVVTGSYSWKRLIDSVAQQQNQPKKPGFSLKDGGTLFKAGPASIKFQFNSKHGGFDILDINF